MAKVIQKFMVFLIAVLVIVSIGLTLFYFLRNEEVFSFSQDSSDNLIRYVNAGETLDVTVFRQNPSSEQYNLVSQDDSIIKFKEKLSDNVFRFETTGSVGGSTAIKLETSNAKFRDLSLTVRVGIGEKEKPFFVRNYTDLNNIGRSSNFAKTANYLQVADIDMSVANSAWTPICNNDTFMGSYNGNNHTIFNFKMEQSASTEDVNADVNDSTNYVSADIRSAGLFYAIGFDAAVTKLNFDTVTIKGDFDTIGVLAAANNGVAKFIKVNNANLEATNSTAVIGGVVGVMNGNTEYSAKMMYSNYVGDIKGGLTVAGIVGQNKGGLVMNNFSRGSITNSNDAAIAGGIVGSNVSIFTSSILKASVIENYSTMNIVAPDAAILGGVIGKNVNNDGKNTIVLHPETDTEKSYNRIYGNYYLQFDGSTMPGVGELANSADSYIAMAVAKSAMNTVATAEDLARINAEDAAFEPNLAYITYAKDGVYSIWNFSGIWEMEASVNENFPVIRADATPTKEFIYNGEKPATPVEPVDPSEPVDPEEPDNPDPEEPEVGPMTQSEFLALFEADLADDSLYNGEYLIDRDVVMTEAWTPIGTKDKKFNGKFVMADGVSIQNLYITDADTQYYGLFGYLGSDAEVYGVQIKGLKIDLSVEQTDEIFVGGIAGFSESTAVNDIYDATYTSSVRSVDNGGYNYISVANKANAHIGSLVGYMAENAILAKSLGEVSIIVKDCNGATLRVGGLVGTNYGTIIDSQYSNAYDDMSNTYLYNIDVEQNADSTILVGGLAGQNSYRVVNSKAFAKVIASKAQNVYAGGLAGLNEGFLGLSKAQVSINGGYFAGGLVGHNKVSDLYGSGNLSNTEAVTRCAANGSVTGEKVGGLIGKGECGTITNRYNTCALSGKIMGGFAAEVLRASDTNCAKISYCYSSATFDTSAGAAYWETSSVVRQTNGWWAGNQKLAGYVENCIYNIHDNIPAENAKIDSIERQYSYYILGTGYECDDGRNSDADCKKLSTFTGRGNGFDATIWTLVDGAEPSIAFPTLIYK